MARLRKPVALTKKNLFTSGALLALLVGVYAVAARWDDVAVDVTEFVAKTVDAKAEHIWVEGVRYSAPADLKAALELEKGSSLVGFDAGAVRARLEHLPWVRAASVERHLPSTVKIRVWEHVPFVRLQEGEAVWVVDRNGRKIATADGRFAEMPLVTGEAAFDNIPSLFSIVSAVSGVSSPLVGADYVSERRWNLLFKSGVIAELPEDTAVQAVELLKGLDAKRGVLSVKGAVVDLRLDDRIVLRLPPLGTSKTAVASAKKAAPAKKK